MKIHVEKHLCLIIKEHEDGVVRWFFSFAYGDVEWR